MTRFHVGYYLFAILFLMFDVETVFLYPWAVCLRALGGAGVAAVAVFRNLSAGPCLRLAERST